MFQLKEEICTALCENPVSPRNMRIYLSASEDRKPIPDAATLSDHDVTNDTILYLVLRRSGTERGNEDEFEESCWEDIDIVEDS
eukprot:CAMPEP_0184855410 /NCGR_PEP_ID=MMETSP0580-20130426/678_1 /TAXON_ID=1118495 /ORGANISM="Dactyliosolen fragilissimus" /LENGTH=83 /DNA_ID=CAMNT_0027349921 /DNA_START=391 /DNA_END=642 /DNA_ORIENTATION=-